MKFGKPRSALVLAGALAIVAGLVATFPARLALAWFAPPQLRAWGVAGTVWEGRAMELALGDQSLGSLSWDARVARMLLLRPSWDIELRRPDGYARAGVGLSLFGNRQYISDVDASVSLGTLPRAIVPDGVAGEARLALQRLEVADGWPTAIAGRATVANLELPGVILALGPFEFSFPEDSEPPVAEIRSLGGPLAVDGRVDLPARGQWRFSAELAPGEDPPRELIEGLAFVGEDIGEGRRRLVLSSEP